MATVAARIVRYVTALRENIPFTLANYGDGEWACITGARGANCDGEAYAPKLAADLAATLRYPRFTWCGTCPGAKMKEHAREWLIENGLNGFSLTPDTCISDPGLITWVHKELLPSANLRGELGPLIAEFRKRKVCLVGPAHLRALTLFPVMAFIEVPLPGAYAARDTTEHAVRLAIVAGAEIVLWSSGLATKVSMWHIAATHPDLTMMDCGALWDPYVGVLSRSGYRRPDWPAAMAQNIAEAGHV